MEEISIIRTRVFSYVPWLNKFLSNVPKFRNIDCVIKKAGVRLPLGFFVLLSLFFGSLGFLGGWIIGKKFILGVLGAGLLGILPSFYILYKKKKRMKLFQKQLPDVLDLLSRSLRAGHSFPAGILMVADEFPDPIGTEFKKVSSEIYYGLSLNDALENLTKRVDCEDLGFFITSVIIQRETGGNLSEMMDSIAHIIRERFKLFAKVKALASEGILSAWLLSLLPFGVGAFIFMSNREYISLLFSDPLGQKMAIGAAIWFFLGILLMKKMVNIKI
ncbi:MAG: type II secretion system F family protein [Thermodesulfobacteriota bacterium]|nr:type II secretion system F family protein [Thermodesulfobacteriota bacterium]